MFNPEEKTDTEFEVRGGYMRRNRRLNHYPLTLVDTIMTFVTVASLHDLFPDVTTYVYPFQSGNPLFPHLFPPKKRPTTPRGSLDTRRSGTL